MRAELKLRLYGGVAVAGLLLAGAAMADDFVVGNGQTVGQQTLNDSGDTLLIEQGGTVSTGNDAEHAVEMSDSGQTITNDGEVTTTGNGAVGILSTGDNATISNSGDITTTGSVFPNITDGADGIESSGADATISNSGNITTAGFGANGISSDGADATISNSGDITTTGSSAEGIFSDGDNATISNSGAITTEGGAEGIESSGDNATLSNSGNITIEDGFADDGISSSGANAKISNSGTITNRAEGGVGISSTGANATVSNSGDITAGDVFSSGIFSDGDNATISNSGDITATEVFSDGIETSGANASISNSGTITTEGNAGTGIAAGGANASISNSGDITTTGNFEGTPSESADGIQVFGAHSTVSNNGNITTSGDYADGIQVFSTGATVSNSGSIQTSGLAAFGIYSLGDDATINNGGDITTLGGGHGIYSDGSDATISNSGAITTADSAIGIFSEGTAAMISNSGTINALGDGADGIYSTGDGVTISNSGSITTYDNGADGIEANGANAVISNSGTIKTSGPDADGIFSGGINAMISNSGTISTSGDDATGITAIEDDATVNNSGTIISALGDAIWMRGSSATVNLQAGTALQGGIVFDAPASATLNIGPGLNTALTLTGTPDTINVNGMPLTGAGNALLSGNLLAVVDVTGFAVTDDVLTDLTRSITGSVEGHLAAQRWCHGDGQRSTPMHQACGTGLWGSLFGGYSDMQATGTTSDAEHGFGGVLLGYDLALSQATTGGLFAGFSKGEVTTPHAAFSNDMTGAYGGAYLSHVTHGMFFDLSVMAGVLINETERLVANNQVEGGLETASADYDGIVFSPSMKVGFNHGLGGSTLTPSVRVRYAGLYLDGYEEAGSAVNLTVADRDVHVVEVRGELALALATREVESGVWQTQLKGGVDGIFNWGDDVNASLLGNDITFAAGKHDEVIRGFGGAEAVFTSHGGTQFTAGVEFGYDSAETFTTDARLGMNVPF